MCTHNLGSSVCLWGTTWSHHIQIAPSINCTIDYIVVTTPKLAELVSPKYCDTSIPEMFPKLRIIKLIFHKGFLFENHGFTVEYVSGEQVLVIAS